MRYLFILLTLCFCSTQAQQVPDRYESNETPTYQETVAFYKTLASKYPRSRLMEYGSTDVGLPLHLFVITKDGNFDPQKIHQNNKTILLINNGIHPGEPDGIDACIKLSKELLETNSSVLDNLVICIIPVYNVDGALNRGCCSRANQNGPKEYGFRGNGRNLDLNRDFVKCDSRNSKAFTQIFQTWNPDIFVDTHVSDGADYQYLMTLIEGQQDKMNPVLADFMKTNLVPYLYKDMEKRGYEMTPYVDSYKETPDDGICGFLETPRFSSGYAALFNTIPFITETHMLKPYKERVLSTYHFLTSIAVYGNSHSLEIRKCREKAIQGTLIQKNFPLKWVLDTTDFKSIQFKGYKAVYKQSNISGLQRLSYDRSEPYVKQIKFYNTYRSVDSASKPMAYVIPQAWGEVIERLKLNGIRYKVLKQDTVIKGEVYYIADYHSASKPYEGHYLHSNVKLKKETQNVQFHRGDWFIEMNQSGNRYVMETLEPQAVDSYFCWNFFDSILQQKEGYSDYVFEELAEDLLKKDPALLADLKTKQNNDPVFAKDHNAQLDFVYKRSPYFEKSFLRYPVVRIN